MTRTRFTDEIIYQLRARVISHNEAHPQTSTKLTDLKREYKFSHKGANPGARAMAAVDAYLQHLVAKTETGTPGRMPPSIAVPMSSQSTYESGALLFAWLAFPGSDEEIERWEAYVMLCNTALHVMVTKDPASSWVPQLIKPGYLIYPEKKVNRILRTFGRRLRDRLTASLMAIPLLKEAETGSASEMPRGVTRLSVAQLANFGAAFSGEESPVNVRSRVWTPSLPVIHLAAAVAVTTSLARQAGATECDVPSLCCNQVFIRTVFRTAEKYEGLLVLAPKLQLALARLLRFRLT